MPDTTRRDHRADTPPPRTGSAETEVLRGFLDYLRNSIVAKVEGAPEPRVRAAAVPSGANLLGLLNHSTAVERWTFLGDDITDWQPTFQAAPEHGAADVVARYRDAVECANAVLDECTELNAPVPGPRRGRPGPSARWALTLSRRFGGSKRLLRCGSGPGAWGDRAPTHWSGGGPTPAVTPCRGDAEEARSPRQVP
ncbi:mycothiol transferase [Streptomyces noursei]|uniref:mycothiol transferase n=1 Tax=Streptomyces noursei TaxID=1971 RepID=UPI0035DEB0A9